MQILHQGVPRDAVSIDIDNYRIEINEKQLRKILKKIKTKQKTKRLLGGQSTN